MAAAEAAMAAEAAGEAAAKAARCGATGLDLAKGRGLATALLMAAAVRTRAEAEVARRVAAIEVGASLR